MMLFSTKQEHTTSPHLTIDNNPVLFDGFGSYVTVECGFAEHRARFLDPAPRTYPRFSV